MKLEELRQKVSTDLFLFLPTTYKSWQFDKIYIYNYKVG